jgi:proline dehydrogenase
MATHDGRLREALLLAHGPLPVEQLFGVRPEILDELHARGIPTRVYVPYGPDWYRYWLRRVAESAALDVPPSGPFNDPRWR